MPDFTKLRINPANPRVLKKERFEKLKSSILSFTKMLEIRSIAYDSDGVIWGGNMRYQALKALDIEMKPEYFKELVGYTEKEKREFAVRDNVEFGEWDYDILANEWSDLPLEEWGIDTTGWDGEVEEDEVPEVSTEPPISKLGEVYGLGRHRLMCGDAIKIEDVEKLMDGNKADMVFTDPPYNVDYKGTSGKIKNDSFKTNKAFYQFLYDSISSIRPFVIGDVYIAMSSSELHTLQKAFMDCGGHWSTFIIWVKNTFTLGRSNYQRQYEPILYGWFEGSSHYWSGIRKLGDVVKQEDAYNVGLDTYLKVDNLPMDIWEFPKPTKNKEHPTMKPIALCARGISNSSKRNGSVLDVFGGSGSTLIACEQLERVCYMMELDPKYCDVIRKRYAKFIGKEEEWRTTTPKT